MNQSPSGGAGSGTATGAGGPMSIGAVLNLLREEFPEVTVSKIRFLEAEGLVEPRRSPSGYRKFDVEDVERLGYVLRMQRDHYLPLKVIREHLDALARGEQPPLPVQRRDPLESIAASVRPGARMSRGELIAASGVTEKDLGDWESYGLLDADAEGRFAAEEAAVVRLLADLSRFGLGPRHLRVVKAAADREADLVEQVVAPLRKHRNPQTRVQAEETVEELAALSVQLHAALLQSALRSRSR